MCCEAFSEEAWKGNFSLEIEDGVDILHALRAAPFIAVVEIEAFALEDECTHTILRWRSAYTGSNSGEHTWAVDVVRSAVTGIL